MSEKTTEGLVAALEDWCNVATEDIQRLTIVGPMTRKRDVLDTLWDNGFCVTCVQPMTSEKMSPRIDSTRFIIIAETKVKRRTG